MLEFVIIVESEADFRTATGIAERVFKEWGPDWLEDYLPDKFRWSGLESHEDFTCWRDIKKIINRAGLRNNKSPRSIGRRKNGLEKSDAAMARKALALVEYFQRERNIDGVIFIRDLDNEPERRAGLEEAYKDNYTALIQAFVIGAAAPNREAWVLNGFEAEDDGERKELAQIQNEIEFDPCTEAHRLRSSRTDSTANQARKIKVVLSRLTQDNFDREERCWADTDLDILKDRGKQTGLTQFIEEVEERLLPLLE